MIKYKYIIPASYLLTTAGLDYFHVSRVVTFESSGQKWCVRVQLVNDPEVERDKTFTIQLSSNLEGTAVVLDPKLASILIIDDDGMFCTF